MAAPATKGTIRGKAEKRLAGQAREQINDQGSWEVVEDDVE